MTAAVPYIHALAPSTGIPPDRLLSYIVTPASARRCGRPMPWCGSGFRGWGVRQVPVDHLWNVRPPVLLSLVFCMDHRAAGMSVRLPPGAESSIVNRQPRGRRHPRRFRDLREMRKDTWYALCAQEAHQVSFRICFAHHTAFAPHVGRTPCGEQHWRRETPPERRHGEEEPCCFQRVPPERDATGSVAVPLRVVDPGDPWQRRDARSVLSVGGSGRASSKAQYFVV